MILIELLAAGQGAPWDELMDVGIAGVVAHMLGLDAAPGRRADDLAGLRDQIVKADLLVLAWEREVGVVASGGLFKRLPRIHSNLAVGLRRQGQDRLDRMNVRQDLRMAFGHDLLEDGSIEVPEKIDLLV